MKIRLRSIRTGFSIETVVAVVNKTRIDFSGTIAIPLNEKNAIRLLNVNSICTCPGTPSYGSSIRGRLVPLRIPYYGNPPSMVTPRPAPPRQSSRGDASLRGHFSPRLPDPETVLTTSLAKTAPAFLGATISAPDNLFEALCMPFSLSAR